MTEYPCQNKPDLFEPFVAPQESMALRGLRLVNIQKMCEDCPLRQHCEDLGARNDLRRGMWGGRVHTRLDEPPKRKRKR